jgi:hypothetical protein
MNKDLSSWIEYLSNSMALDNMFGGNVPALDSLDLVHLGIDQTSHVYVSLNFRSLPPGSPIRWIARGCDCVQLRLRFSDVSMISIVGALEDNLEVVASFGPGKHFSMSHPHFKVELAYRHANADMYPFDSSIFEEPGTWHYR